MAKKTEFQRRVSMMRQVDNYLKNKAAEEKTKKNNKHTEAPKRHKHDDDHTEDLNNINIVE